MRAFGPKVTRDRDLIIITIHTENRTQSLQQTETSYVLCLNVFRESRLGFQSFSFLPFMFFCWVLPCDKPRFFCADWSPGGESHGNLSCCCSGMEAQDPEHGFTVDLGLRWSGGLVLKLCILRHQGAGNGLRIILNVGVSCLCLSNAGIIGSFSLCCVLWA